MRSVGTNCTAMCKLLDGPARKRNMTSICICGRGIGEDDPMSDEKLEAIAKFLEGKTSVNVDTAREMLVEIRRLRAKEAKS